MVGTPKSTGCQTCRRRKKKCDERLPACSECIRAGWSCPGYDRRWKFVDENKQLSRRYGTNGCSEPSSAEPPDEGPVISGCCLSSPTRDNRLDLYEAVNLGSAVCHNGIFWPLSSEADKHANLFISIIDSEQAQSLLPLKAFGSFVSSIPSRLGWNTALDAVTACVCSIYVDYLTTKSTGSIATTRKYISSLNALQICVGDPKFRSQSETICASILIQTCELMVTKDIDRWCALNRGCALIFKDCDPERFTSGFDRDMLDSQRPMFITQAMLVGEQCFLARPEWQEAIRTPTEPSVYGSEATELKHMLSKHLINLPGMIQEAADLVVWHAAQRGAGQLSRHPRLEGARFRLLQIKQDFEMCRVRVPSPYGPNGWQLLASKQQHNQVLLATLDCVVDSVLVKLDRMLLCLSTLGPPTAYGAQGLVRRADMQATERRQVNAQATFAYIKMACDVATKPLVVGLKMISANDNLFEIPISKTVDEIGVDLSAHIFERPTSLAS